MDGASGNGTLCANSWLALITWMLIVLNNWFLNVSNLKQYAERETLQSAADKLSERGTLPLGKTAVQVIRSVLYVLVIAAYFIFWLYDDACEAGGALQEYSGLQIAVWVVIIASILANKARQINLDVEQLAYARINFWLNVAELAGVVFITVCFFIFSAERAEILFSAIVSVLYLVYQAYATYASLSVLRYFSPRRRKVRR